ncbi:MAG: alpha/beta hydrolase family protein [Candidatus Thorarchaeota archaeon]
MRKIQENQSTLLEDTEFIIDNELSHRDHKNLRKIVILIFILIITLTFLNINRAQSYKKYERIQFESSGSILYANLYYPSKVLDFQEKYPLIIYCHGIGSKRDLDLRIPIEFSKRGFFVAALDYQGHGESSGKVFNIDPLTNIPAIAQDCSRLLDKLENLPVYSIINSSQIGLIGHSLGGMVVLMNQALDSRFEATVALAPLVNFLPPKFGFVYDDNLIDYIPVNLLNIENSQNLLIIMHINDEMLDFTDNALVAQELTNCTVIGIQGELIGGGHQLFSDQVLINSINWFEHHFFGSIIINGGIYISFYLNYILIFLNITLIFVIVISLISVSSRLFFRKKHQPKNLKALGSKIFIDTSNRGKDIIKIPLLIVVFLFNWYILEYIYGIKGILYASLYFLFAYFGLKIFKFFRKSKIERCRCRIKEILKLQFNIKYMVFTIISTMYFIAIYMIFSFYYPFGFIWPSNFAVHFTLGYLVFPIFLSIEILLRKLIYPQLKSLKSESSKTRVLTLISLIIMIVLMFLSMRISILPSSLFMYIMFLLVIIQNTKIFQNVKSFYPVVIITFIVVQIFFAGVLSNAIGVNINL